MLYQLRTITKKSDAIIDLKSNSSKIFNYFVSNEGDGNFLNFTTVSFTTQDGYTIEDLKKSDFLQPSSNILVFSKKAKELIDLEVGNELIFYPCIVYYRNEKFDFFVCKITSYEFLVNDKTSKFRTLTDGREVLSFPVFNRTEENFYIAKDQKFKHIYAISEKFANLINEHKLNIDLAILPYSL